MAALEVLSAVGRGAFIDRAFDRVLDGLEEADRRLVQELSYGVTRLRARLDFILDALVRGGLEGLEPVVRDILRLGAYQLLELDRIPDYAAVSEAVEAARRYAGEGAAGLTNAVLRRLAREGLISVRFPVPEEEPERYLATWGSHPRWLVSRWLGRWTYEEVERLVEHNNRRPRVYLSLLESPEPAVGRLRAAGLEVERTVWDRSVRIDSGEIERALEMVRAVVQDPAAAGVVQYSAFPPDEEIVDYCSAPGGKAALLVSASHTVTALEVSRKRVVRLAELRDRLGLKNLSVAVADGSHPPLRRAAGILVDAPCTGTGTLQRHPDARWRLSAGDLEDLARLQTRLLDAAAAILEPGGYLVYATCSLESEENERQVEGFLDRTPDFERAPPTRDAVPAAFLTMRGEYLTLPQRDGIDGAYAARLRRRGA